MGCLLVQISSWNTSRLPPPNQGTYQDKTSCRNNQNLAQKASLPKALQQTQQDFLAQKATPNTAQPYFWAAYTSLGAPQSPITPSRNNWLWGSALGCVLLGLGYFRWSRSKQAKEGA